ncbi:MAG: anaerobic ribonucleoside-triphosphate reductase activating protein [Candidatus Cloacimonetes bacterium]|nr:anaerobic ribonucleoside-triphosphate reductase activating protein [Candidatus Cloacimonadota bacterium]
MIIGGFLKFTLIDYPGKIAASIFTRGCNFRCPYCHNPQLVLPRRYQLPLDNNEILNLLQERFGRLDGIVITGGEPLLQEGLEIFLEKLKAIGYAVKLDTNGSRANPLKKLINRELVDYIAMDIKAPFQHYVKSIQVPVNLEQIKKSIDIIRESGLDYEFRTTIARNLHTNAEIKEISEFLVPGDNYYLQNYIEARRVGHTNMELQPFEKSELEELTAYFCGLGINCQSR